jgi:adenine-specific DNA glycosylase
MSMHLPAPATIDAPAVLAWYDRHARDLPWRVSPADRAGGVRPDPYRIWLSEVMLQQTTVAAVKSYFLRFTSLWPPARRRVPPNIGRAANAPRGRRLYQRRHSSDLF